MFINGLVPPLPAAKRCFALGEAVRKAIHRWPQGLRVAVLASGSFSLEVGGPRINPGEAFDVPVRDANPMDVFNHPYFYAGLDQAAA